MQIVLSLRSVCSVLLFLVLLENIPFQCKTILKHAVYNIHNCSVPIVITDFKFFYNQDSIVFKIADIEGGT